MHCLVDPALLLPARKEMSEEQPVLDICLLYACYRGHGKTIDRSDWFVDFRDETVKHKKKVAGAPKRKSKATGRPKSSERGGGGADPAAADAGIDPTGGAELLARFEHASDQLASMGYVRPLKRRRNLELERGGRGKGKGEGPGPKGAVTRLVFSYTMEDGEL